MIWFPALVTAASDLARLGLFARMRAVDQVDLFPFKNKKVFPFLLFFFYSINA